MRCNDRLVIDVYVDANGDGKADPTRDTSVPPDGILDTAFCDDAPHQCDKIMSDIVPIWEGGRNLALMSSSSRKIFTWVDLDNNKLVKNISIPTGAATEEYISFDSTNATKLTGYLNLSGAPAAYTAANIIDFIRGTQVTGLRDRMLTVKDSSGTPVSAVWKLGDSVYSTPVVVGAPRERYDLLYGDTGYTSFYSLYQESAAGGLSWSERWDDACLQRRFLSRGRQLGDSREDRARVVRQYRPPRMGVE